MNSIKIHPDLIKVNEIFEKNGFKAYLVGGAVRDMILGKKSHDYDIATDATPDQVMKIFHRVIPTGIAHGTVTIHIFGLELETTTFRTEAGYSDGRHPDKIAFASTIEEDLSRRDFTMNAIAAELGTGKLVDPFKGQEDIKNKIIRTVGDPLERFDEDGLRPVRAIRFAGQLGFKIEENTFKSLSDSKVLAKTASISVERFHDEFCKMLMTEKPSICIKLLEETGILDIFIPEFKICRGCTQQDFRGYHEFDVADHIIYACDGAPRDNLIVRLAAFYHDIGKPQARKTEMVKLPDDPDGIEREVIHYHGHEHISEKICRESMTKLKFSNAEIDRVCHLVDEHMFHYEPNWSNAAVRRFVIRIGKENINDLMALRFADTYGMHNCPVVEGSPTWMNVLELRNRIEEVASENAVLSIKSLKVNGNDLIQNGIPAGKVMGVILKELFETVTDSPEMNDREKLLNLAKNLYTEKYSRF